MAEWLKALMGWPWYALGWNWVLGAVLVLPLVLWVLRVLGRRVGGLSGLRRGPVRWAVAVVVTFVASTWDVIVVSREANRLCREQGGLHVYRTVEAEGFLGASSIEYWSHYGFKYVEGGGTRGRKFRATIRNGQPMDEEVDHYISRYQWKGVENHVQVTPYIARSASHVVDRETGEELGRLVWFSVHPASWLDRLFLGLAGFTFTPWICGDEVPPDRQAVWGRHYDRHDLILTTLRPQVLEHGTGD